jgi:hypothetical protein
MGPYLIHRHPSLKLLNALNLGCSSFITSLGYPSFYSSFPSYYHFNPCLTSLHLNLEVLIIVMAVIVIGIIVIKVIKAMSFLPHILIICFIFWVSFLLFIFRSMVLTKLFIYLNYYFEYYCFTY